MKEQQKQYLIDIIKADEELGLYEETIIQAKYRLYKEHWNEDHTQLVKSNFLIGFDEGAKWKRERMYSEEEALRMLDLFRVYFMLDIKKEDIIKWFERFKKK